MLTPTDKATNDEVAKVLGTESQKQASMLLSMVTRPLLTSFQLSLKGSMNSNFKKELKSEFSNWYA